MPNIAPEAAPMLYALLTALCVALFAQPARAAEVVSVAAASDLKFAFDGLMQELKKEHPELEVRATFGSSGNIYAQLVNKAPYDLFLSADVDYPRRLIEQGLADGGSEFVYAIGHLVVWLPSKSKLDLAKRGIQALTDPSIKKIAIANPAHAPYGRAAEAALKKLGVYEQIKGRLVFGENAAQAAQYAEGGNADAAIIPQALALAPAMKASGRTWVVPVDAFPKLEQGGVITRHGKNPKGAAVVRAFLLSPQGRAALSRFGFEPQAGG